MRALPQLPSPTGTALVDAQTLELSAVRDRMPPPEPSFFTRAYPWMLIASTGLAAVFCVLYLTKPVIVTGGSATAAPAAASPVVSLPQTTPAAVIPKTESRVLPDAKSLPGDSARPEATDPRGLGPGNANPFEETNLRVQHVLGAQGPAGEDLGRIVLDVPVLYRSRSLRWTPKEIARARQLMAGISNYQEKSRALREEGSQLLASWNELIGFSIPVETLRADSPTLPANQDSGHANGGNLDTIHSIEIDHR